MLIPGGERLLIFDVPADAALDSLNTAFGHAVCLWVIGGGTTVVNEVTYHAGMELTFKLCTPVSE